MSPVGRASNDPPGQPGDRNMYDDCTRSNVTAEGKTIPLSLVADLDSISTECPNGLYTVQCPFQKLSGLSRASRRTIFAQMNLSQVEKLFNLATDCNACPKDPRRKSGGN